MKLTRGSFTFSHEKEMTIKSGTRMTLNLKFEKESDAEYL